VMGRALVRVSLTLSVGLTRGKGLGLNVPSN